MALGFGAISESALGSQSTSGIITSTGTTSQAQSCAATGAISADTVTATSQAQTVAGTDILTATIATSQAQSMAAVGDVAVSYVGGTLTIGSLTASGVVDPSKDGSVEIETFTLEATGEAGAYTVGDSFFPDIAVSGGTDDGMRLSFLSLSASGLAGNTADGNIVVNLLRAAGGTADGIVLEEFTLAASGIAGLLIEGAATLPLFSLAGAIDAPLSIEELSLSGTMLSGAVMDGAIAVSAPTVAAIMAPRADILLEEITVSGTALAGGVHVGAIAFQAPSVVATAYESTTSAGDVTFGILSAFGSVAGAVLINGDVTLPRAALDAAAVAGNVAVAALTLPLLVLDGSGYLSAIGTAQIELSAILADGWMTNAQALANTTTIALNTRVKAVTTYDGVAFNSFANFAGVTLAASADGIVALAGDTDLDVAIDAYALSGVSDFGSESFKRVLTGYVGYRAAGDIELTLITDEHHEYIYRLQPRQGAESIHASRVKFGRGVDGKYWQWRLANVGGGAFDVDSLTFNPQELKRRM